MNWKSKRTLRAENEELKKAASRLFKELQKELDRSATYKAKIKDLNEVVLAYHREVDR